MEQQITFGTRVVRTYGGHVIGRVGTVIDLDLKRNRAQVEWHGDGLRTTWAAFEVLAPEDIPYRIEPASDKQLNPKYIRL